MIRKLATAAAFGLAALPALALDLDKMSDADRSAFRAEIRAYLLDNPEVIMEAVQILEQRQAESEAAHDFSLVEKYADPIFSDGYSWVGGNPNGDITLVEFVDYRCGYCRRAHDEVQQLVDTDGNIRLILKEFPILGEQSTLSSQFAIAVKQLNGDDAYKQVHDALISFKGDVNTTALSRLADTMGYDGQALLAHMASPAVADEIAQTRQLAGALNISGTPTFVMQDQLLRGYLPYRNMKALVEEKRGN
ncbi:Thiol-disulfide oxidoreductase D [Shimia thalassica]|uniref:Thiol-disulfide oxidoreductase D n=1 Tax=Shimia thalassica TaxID=1715693 RepID=A0A0N7M9F0_9RHOB|nr:DsbA family protein [Shimia thalassica]CUJ98641.1 Thiol-disulfide oxidoreductase D [Shimia thalassica]